MERNNSDLCRKTPVVSQEGSLSEAKTTITMGRSFELKDSATRERALEIPGRPRLAVLLLVVMPGTRSAEL
jgi:hypothetical protein